MTTKYLTLKEIESNLISSSGLYIVMQYKLSVIDVNFFQLPLLRLEKGQFFVNADSHILNLIHESKWMLRMKLEIPETAKLILAKEKQFKYFKIHLEQCLQDYTAVSVVRN